mgnify:CR=1 FL=1
MLEQKITETVNQIRDNLWLGDVQKIKEIITILRMEEFKDKFKKSFDEVSYSFKMARKVSKERYRGFEYKLFLSQEFKERIKESSKLKEAIAASLLFDLEMLLERLNDIEPFCKVVQKPLYRYTIFEYPPKYEIRALIDRRLECSVKGLVKRLEEEGFKVSKIDEKRYAYVVAFSVEGYIEISMLLPKVTINISLLAPNKERAQELGEMIINSLIS